MKTESDFVLGGLDEIEKDLKEGFERMQTGHENKQSSNYFYVFDIGFKCPRHKKYSVLKPRPFGWDLRKKLAVGAGIHKEYQLSLAQKGYSIEVPIKKYYDEFGFTLSGKIDAKKRDNLLELKSAAYFKYIKSPYEANVLQTQMYLDMASMEQGSVVYISPYDGSVKIFKIKRDNNLIIENLERLEIVKYAIEDKTLPEKCVTRGCDTCLYKRECENNTDF